jgi:hypothetical protein
MLQLDPTEILGMKLIIWVFRSQERIQIDYETTPTALAQPSLANTLKDVSTTRILLIYRGKPMMDRLSVLEYDLLPGSEILMHLFVRLNFAILLPPHTDFSR